MSGIVLPLAVICVCMAGHAFFAGIETGVISIHRMRLRHFIRQGMPGAGVLEGFLDSWDRLLGTTLVGTNVCLVVISVVCASLSVRLLGPWGETASTVVVTLVVLFLAEYLPKAWFHCRPIARSIRFVGILRFFEILLKPVAAVVVGLTRWMVPGPAKAFSRPAPFATREDLKFLAHEGEKNGILSARERFMIHRVFELSGKRAGQIMVPRDRMTIVYTDTKVREFFQTARESGFTRMPIYDRGRQEFAGVINVFYLLSRADVDPESALAQFVRPPLFVSEDMPVDDILPRLRRFRQPMCLVIDGKSEVTGLITTEDILEEIVGQL